MMIEIQSFLFFQRDKTKKTVLSFSNSNLFVKLLISKNAACILLIQTAYFKPPYL